MAEDVLLHVFDTLATEDLDACAVALARMACVCSRWRAVLQHRANAARARALQQAKCGLQSANCASLNELRTSSRRPLLQRDCVALSHLAEADGSLRSLDLSTRALCGSTGTAAIAAAARRGAFDHLALGSVHKQGALALADALRYGVQCLRSLNLDSNVHIGSYGLGCIGAALQHSSLAELSVKQASVDSDAARGIAQGLKNSNALSSLILRHNPLGLSGFANICAGVYRSHSLHKLDLSYVQPLQGIHAASALSKAITAQGVPLQCLELERVFATSEGLQLVAQALPHAKLKKLNLSKNPVSREALSALGEGISLSSVRDLSLDECLVSRSEAEAMAHGAVTKAGASTLSLDKLSLRTEGSKDKPGTFDGPALAEIVHLLRDVEHLDLSHQQIADAGAIALSKMLHRVGNLKLTACGIGDIGAQAIASIHAEHLHLDDNHIKQQGAKALSESAVHTLDLSGNAIRNEGAIALAEGMRPAKGTRFSNIVLDMNSISSEGMDALARALRVRWDAHISLSGNEVDSKVFKRLNLNESQRARMRL